ncbi:MAG: septum formation inhibitor Maf [Gammaproteobacteria bacterium]|nr:MAG: septum formation inhibitor Maf [Gammaproteobacteria bacterium]UTW42256.1 septum formation inhibitor Maf [bacterium SCSIO 12844]
MLYLASQSPRRYQLLKQLNIDFQQFSVDVDESVLNNEQPNEYINRVVEMKKIKAQQEVKLKDTILVADTMVTLNGKILGKPNNYNDAKRMLKLLSGNEHEVYTTVCIAQGNHSEKLNCISQVKFRVIDETEIKAYWNSGEPCDKAGAYGIQGLGSIFVESICGSHSAIMGLPLFETAQLLSKFGISVLNESE